uniref:Fasciclin-like arabinogalactan protein 14 n=1 Tax=Nicotiana sylvestris TaxID=4096 RepID=A0A1U7X0J1_NICSY|nr:PREDICTED: fasciclin-like arabinogalactan protein 14 [Nicotiana sylvestris]
MNNFNTSLLFFFFLLNILCYAKAFNITNLLNQYSSFSNFNNYLTQTGVASAINSRQTITVLVVENSNLSPLSGKSQDVLANIMRVHVLLDYYDVQKLQKLPNKTMKAPALFQTTGQANSDQGYLNVTDLGSGSVALGSAAKGATLGSNLVKSVASQPYNISILQISNAIIPLGIDSSANSPSSSPNRAPSPSTSNNSSAPSPGSAPSPNKTSTPTPSPSAAPGSGSSPKPEPPAADTPSEASPSPTPHAPGSPPKPDAPTADTPAAADAPTEDHSPSATSVLDVSLIFVAISNLFFVLVI